MKPSSFNIQSCLLVGLLCQSPFRLPAQSTFAPSPGWSLTSQPVVPEPVAADSKQPADPKDFAEVKMDFKISRGPFEPTWDSIKKNYPGVPDWFSQAKFGVFVH